MSFENKFSELIVGTNEEFLLGFNICPKNDMILELQPSFANHSHTGRIKQVVISDQYLLSGSTDEHLRIFNLHSRKEIGYLLPHEGTITCLEYHESGFFFSAAEDGKIVIYRKGKWEVEKELTGHNSPINSIAIHPTGKLALSLSRDKRMITWDLLKGKRAYMSGLPKAGEIIKWTPSGLQYLISSGTELNIYDISTGCVSQSVNFKENINCILFISDNLVAIGGENKNIYLYNIKIKAEVLCWQAHENRLKCLVQVGGFDDDLKYVASASSDGFIKLWSINLSSVPIKKLIAEVNTKSRIICMAARKLNTDLFDRTDVAMFEREFQQRQEDFCKKDKQRKLNIRSAITKNSSLSGTRPKVIVVQERSSKKMKKEIDVEPDCIENKKTKKINLNNKLSINADRKNKKTNLKKTKIADKKTNKVNSIINQTPTKISKVKRLNQVGSTAKIGSSLNTLIPISNKGLNRKKGFSKSLTKPKSCKLRLKKSLSS